MSTRIVGAARLLAVLGIIAICAPLQAVVLGLRLPWRSALPRLFHRLWGRALGLRVEVEGTPDPQARLLVVNHLSWLDIAVLGGTVKGSFVSKAEVADWPLFGWLATLQRTIFISRRPGEARAQRDLLARRMEAGDRLILFPEGTSSPGLHVLPFKSALLDLALDPVTRRPRADMIIQPVTLCALEADGLPLPRAFADLYAWYGDMTLPRHLWRLVQRENVTVRLRFHASVHAHAFADRKALTRGLHERVAEGLSAMRARRPFHDLALPADEGSLAADQATSGKTGNQQEEPLIYGRMTNRDDSSAAA